MRQRRLRLVVVLVLLAAGAGAGYRYYWLHRYDALIQRAAPTYRLDPRLVRAVVYQESYFNTHASSRAGARGLMQVTEPVVAEWRQERGYDALPREPRQRALSERLAAEAVLADPELNLHIGCWYLAKLLDRFAREPDALSAALAAYNAGPTHAERWLAAREAGPGGRDARAGLLEVIDFPETRRYVAEVTERYERSR